jgi:hypothetical protein
MAADFGINVEIISEEALQAEINKIIGCLKENGIEIETNVDDPGLAALIATLIKSIEKAIITSFEPIIALISVVKEAIDAGLNAINVFLEKIVKVVEAITELLSNLPISIIEFIVNKIIEPIMKYINIPFPSIQGIIEILSGSISLGNIDWDKWLLEGKLVIPQKLKDKGQEKVDQVMTLFKSINGLGVAFLKILELLLFPIKFAIGVIEAVLNKAGELAENLFDAIAEIVSLIGNPVQWLLDFIAGIFADILAPIVIEFIPNINVENIQAFIAKFKELIASIFKIGAIRIDIDKWIENLPTGLREIFKQIVAFIKLIQCFIFWLVGLLNPQTVLSIFGLGGGSFKFPPVKAIGWLRNSKSFRIELGDMATDDLQKMFKTDDKIEIVRGNRSPIIATVVNAFGSTITVRENVYGETLNETFEITKKI